MRSRLCVLIAIAMICSLSGCGPTKEAYLAESSYYSAMSAVVAQQTSNPILLEIKAKDPEKDIVLSNVESITVYAPPQPQNGPLIPQYRHEDFNAKWIPVALGLGTAAISVGGMGYMVHELGKWATGTTYNMMGQGSSVKVQGGTTANINQSGGTMGSVGATDATSTPTVMEPSVHIVNQPEPVVVNPVVVGQ